MDPIAVDIRLIRSVLGPELRIAPGRALMARVAAADGFGRGAISIAGVVIDAALPKHVRAGEDLRLVVRDVSPQRVVLSISEQATAAPAAAPAVPLPGSAGTVQVTEREQRPANQGGGDGFHSVTLRYDAPTLGALDLRFELDRSSLRVLVSAAAGEPFERTRVGADALREALAVAVNRAIAVTVSPRHEPLDVYA